MSDIKTQEAFDDIFSLVEDKYSISLELPSKGIGYNHTKGLVNIRTMTFEDEKFIASYTGDSILDDLIKRCVSDVDLDELYLEDKLFLYYKMREQSFGSFIKTNASCRHCGTLNNLEIDMSKLNITYADDNFKDPIEVTLPTLKKTVVVKKMRSDLQRYAVNDSMLLDNLWRFVIKIDSYTDGVLISKVIKKLSSSDIRFIMSQINKTSFGIDTKAKFICNKCSKENISDVGLGFDFFTVS